MTSLDEQITALAAEYQELIRYDHHKERDCHFSVEKVWSYGEAPRYRVEQQGYINEWDGPDSFGDPISAHRALLHFLTEIVKREKRREALYSSDGTEHLNDWRD